MNLSPNSSPPTQICRKFVSRFVSPETNLSQICLPIRFPRDKFVSNLSSQFVSPETNLCQYLGLNFRHGKNLIQNLFPNLIQNLIRNLFWKFGKNVCDEITASYLSVKKSLHRNFQPKPDLRYTTTQIRLKNDKIGFEIGFELGKQIVSPRYRPKKHLGLKFSRDKFCLKFVFQFVPRGQICPKFVS